MFAKSIAFVCICVAVTYVTSAPHELGVPHEHPHPIGDHTHDSPDNQWVNETCKYNKATDLVACRDVVQKCLFTPDDVKAITGFCKCKDSVTGLSPLYDTWVKEKHGGVKLCPASDHGGSFPAHHAGTGDSEHQSFNKYLEALNKPVYDQLECCDGKEQGLFNADSTVNVDLWKQNANAITDPKGKAEVLKSIDACLISEKICSPHEFMHCVMDGCYHGLIGTPVWKHT